MAATLTVWRFPTETGADTAVATLQDLRRRRLITLRDAAVVSWPPEAGKPKTRQLRSLAGAGALGGVFWGLLFGIAFFVPLVGAAVGAGVGAVAGALTDIGIDDKFIKEVSTRIRPGSSALFVLSSDAVMDRVLNEFHGQSPELISTNLSYEQEENLRRAFAE
ncbi:DUF1269 domain-containing protein [Nocardia speluncae]|uniref:DUF1269 domain-containing protein n=1 Tax=Nocardia speluncae TaxID=419477 RepID=A0A846XAD2_9NOCA|nr:DUF1269 domain-containing protein [Nocardia speluncae]NKY32407.1 DUF1269 domain-containing protein [Nocardia speluncae]